MKVFVLLESGGIHPEYSIVTIVSDPMKVHHKGEKVPSGYGHGYLPDNAYVDNLRRKPMSQYEDKEIVGEWMADGILYTLVCRDVM